MNPTVLIAIIAFLLGIISCVVLFALYHILRLLITQGERKALPLPRNKIQLVEQLGYLSSMSLSERTDLQLFLRQAQARLDALDKYDDEMRALHYILRNGPPKEK